MKTNTEKPKSPYLLEKSPWPLSDDAQMLDRVSEDAGEDAVFALMSSISGYCIDSREHALIVLDEDQDCRIWLMLTDMLIQKQPGKEPK